MIEVAILLLACLNPEPATTEPLAAYRETQQVPADADPYLFGSGLPDLPVAPTVNNSDPVTYKVWVDPIYNAACFEEKVDQTLSDPRSWPNVQKAYDGETPQFWIILAAPAAACGTEEGPGNSCVWNNGDGTGLITINALGQNRSLMMQGDTRRSAVIVHEVGHILGFGHYAESVMGTNPWFPTSGLPEWRSDTMNSRLISRPSPEEQEISRLVYVERWKSGDDQQLIWDGLPFTTRYGLGGVSDDDAPYSSIGN